MKKRAEIVIIQLAHVSVLIVTGVIGMRKTGIDNNRITALYCRLSQDDGNVGDSMSIMSQKAILERKAKELGIIDYQFYVEM